ncbi:MAG: hypothetical protein ACKVS9_19525, partial [Phycisphaerae bacterium]
RKWAMAKDSKTGAIEPLPPPATEADKTRARQWFKKATQLRDQRNYDYAIESMITGLGFWPDAVDEGHMPLHSIAIQRAQAGGKKPGVFDRMKLGTGGKDAKQAMFNAEMLLAKDPQNPDHLDAMLKNAAKCGFIETVKWISPRVFESMRRDKKPNMARFKSYKTILMELGERAEAESTGPIAAWCYEAAVQSVDYLVGLNPTDMAMRDEQRELSGKLTIVKGKYGSADSFRESLQDAERQKQLYDSERMKQSENSLEGVVDTAKKDYQANPTVIGKVLAYADALLKSEKKIDEDAAIAMLIENYEKTSNYQFKLRADEILLRQLSRDTRRAVEKARQTKADEDRELARQTARAEYETEVDIYRERVSKYPTDLRMKFKLGQGMFRLGLYDDAIPQLQMAQNDPRSRSVCMLLIGQAFYHKQLPQESIEILREATESHDPPGDDTWKKLVYWSARSFEAADRVEEALATYGKLLRVDYNYLDGEARQRSEALKQKKAV